MPSPRVLSFACVLALAVATFLPSIQNGFVYDDVKIIVDQTELHSLDNVPEILTAPWWSDALYRPLTKLSFAVDWFLGGGQPWLFHLVNVILHVAVTLGVWALANRWIGIGGATVAAAVFAVHPVHVEAVAYVVGRAEVFAALFCVLAALCYRWDGMLSYYDDRSWRRWLAAGGTLLFVLLALASKESAFVVPGLFLLVDWMEARARNDTFEARFRTHWIIWSASVVVALEWLWIRSGVLGDLAGDAPAPGLEGAGLLGRSIAMAPVVLEYLRLLVLPVHLSADYSPDFIPVTTRLTWPGAAGLAVLLVSIVTGFAARKRAPLVTFGLMWTGGAILIVSNLLVPTGVLLAERTLYLPSVGMALVAGAAYTLVPRNRMALANGLVSAILALGLVRSAHRVPVFENDQSFFNNLIADAPGSFRGQWLRGHIAYMNGDRNAGERLFRQALSTYPLFPNVWEDFARRLQEEERWVEAAEAFNVAFRIDSGRVYDAANAVNSFLQAGLLDSAEVYAERARLVAPQHPSVKSALGEIASARGDVIEAMTYHRQAAWLDQDQPYYWYRAASAAIVAGQCTPAVRSVRALAAIDEEYRSLDELREELSELGCVDP